jgi:hypothetical protein
MFTNVFDSLVKNVKKESLVVTGEIILAQRLMPAQSFTEPGHARSITESGHAHQTHVPVEVPPPTIHDLSIKHETWHVGKRRYPVQLIMEWDNC